MRLLSDDAGKHEKPIPVLLRLIVKISERFPAFRRWAWKRWYQHIAGYTVASWSFMNYGFESLDAESARLELQQDDEDDRFCIQLYHQVANAVELAGRNVLEVGSGRGGGASYVARYLSPSSMTGVDFSAKAVSFCRSRHNVDGLKFVVGDAENLPFEDGSVDAVVNVESSHCYGSMPAFLQQVYRVLSTDGHFLYTDFRAADEIDMLEEQLQSAGFTFVEQHDITANVVQAMTLDNQRKQDLIRNHISGWLAMTFQQFAGVEDSEVLQSFRDRAFVYKRYVLRKAVARK